MTFDGIWGQERNTPKILSELNTPVTPFPATGSHHKLPMAIG